PGPHGRRFPQARIRARYGGGGQQARITIEFRFSVRELRVGSTQLRLAPDLLLGPLASPQCIESPAGLIDLALRGLPPGLEFVLPQPSDDLTLAYLLSFFYRQRDNQTKHLER